MQELINKVCESLRVLSGGENDDVSVRCDDLIIALRLDGATHDDIAALIAQAWEMCSAY